MNYGLKGNEHAYNIFYIISELSGTTLNSSMDTLRRSMDLWFKKKKKESLEPRILEGGKKEMRESGFMRQEAQPSY